jgi:hypothetical protein
VSGAQAPEHLAEAISDAAAERARCAADADQAEPV